MVIAMYSTDLPGYEPHQREGFNSNDCRIWLVWNFKVLFLTNIFFFSFDYIGGEIQKRKSIISTYFYIKKTPPKRALFWSDDVVRKGGQKTLLSIWLTKGGFSGVKNVGRTTGEESNEDS